MDIEPLWALGGWFLLPNCMAAAPKTSPSSSSPSVSEFHTKLNPSLLLFISIVFFIFLLLVSPISNPTTTSPSSMASSSSSKRLLLEPSKPAMSTTNLHPKKTQNSRTSATSSTARARREFGAEAHEVPSGPNPISN
ncbi:PREDICTED: CLAVATA3/ESR (CLE)-related protein 44 [Prunus mume]|uniref:CLAVATA3/ESR (CLE)-related protein 44 n=1 Tax=Prunus mume TaxID=102107 RepID=A0ABM0P7L9_PRUMU|nr:PREDICTED: CLAVATA3/ESR (CLE)-related protein 44 [Prunus mume]